MSTSCWQKSKELCCKRWQAPEREVNLLVMPQVEAVKESLKKWTSLVRVRSVPSQQGDMQPVSWMDCAERNSRVWQWERQEQWIWEQKTARKFQLTMLDSWKVATEIQSLCYSVVTGSFLQTSQAEVNGMIERLPLWVQTCAHNNCSDSISDCRMYSSHSFEAGMICKGEDAAAIAEAKNEFSMKLPHLIKWWTKSSQDFLRAKEAEWPAIVKVGPVTLLWLQLTLSMLCKLL